MSQNKPHFKMLPVTLIVRELWMEQREHKSVKSVCDHASVCLSVCLFRCMSAEVTASFCFYGLIQVNMRSVLRAMSGITTVSFHKVIFLHTLSRQRCRNYKSVYMSTYTVCTVCVYVCL